MRENFIFFLIFGEKVGYTVRAGLTVYGALGYVVCGGPSTNITKILEVI